MEVTCRGEARQWQTEPVKIARPPSADRSCRAFHVEPTRIEPPQYLMPAIQLLTKITTKQPKLRPEHIAMSIQHPPWDWQDVEPHFSLDPGTRRAKTNSGAPRRPAKAVPKLVTRSSGRPPPLPRQNSARTDTYRPSGCPSHHGEMGLGEYSALGHPGHYDINANLFVPGSGTPKKKGKAVAAKSVGQSRPRLQAQMKPQAPPQPKQAVEPKKDDGCDCCVVM